MTDMTNADTSALDPKARQSAFVAEVTESKEVWTLKNDEGFATMGGDDDSFDIPFWPNSECAQVMCFGEFDDCTPVSVKLPDFMGKWLIGMDKDGHKVAVFPVPDGTHVTLEPLELLNELVAQLNK
jgi:hypothetical protein